MTEISVLLPVAATTDADDLLRSYQSVVNQIVPPSEILLVTNQSLSDELESTIQNLTDINSITRHKHFPDAQGLGSVLQLGLKECSKSYVARMDADDISEPDRFGEQLKVLIESETDIIGSHISEFYDDPANPEQTRKVPLMHDDIAAWMSWRCPMNHPATMFDREAVIDIGGYRHFPMMEDWDLWARCLAGGLQFRNLDQTLVRAQANDLVNRRNGLNYVYAEINMSSNLYNLGISSKTDILKHFCLRIPPRLLPPRVQKPIYKLFARKN